MTDDESNVVPLFPGFHDEEPAPEPLEASTARLEIFPSGRVSLTSTGPAARRALVAAFAELVRKGVLPAL